MSMFRTIENYIAQIPLNHQVVPPSLSSYDAEPANSSRKPVSSKAGGAVTRTPIEPKSTGGTVLDGNSVFEVNKAASTVPAIRGSTEPTKRPAEGLIPEPNTENPTGECKMPEAVVKETRLFVESFVRATLGVFLHSMATEEFNEAISQCITKPEKPASQEPGTEVIETTANGAAKPAIVKDCTKGFAELIAAAAKPVIVKNYTQGFVDPIDGAVNEGSENPVAEGRKLQPTDPVILGHARKHMETSVENSEEHVDLTIKDFCHDASLKGPNASHETNVIRGESIMESTEVLW
jgi:hypothetical protein